MKNFKIAMILVAAAAFFCSCGGEKVFDVTLTEKNNVVTYDLASANSLPVSIICTVKADNGSKTLNVTRTIKNGDAVVGNVVEYEFEEDPAGKTEHTFEIPDTLFKNELAAGYTVVYNVAAVDKKDDTKDGSYEINVVYSATPLSANWSEIIYLARPSMTGYAQVGNTPVNQSENTTIGVKVTNTNTSTETRIETTANCEGFVVVTTDEFDSAEALAEAYAAGTAETFLLLPFDYHSKAYAEKNFIAKVDNAYVLVKYASGDVCPNGWNGIAGNVYGFKYKKAETAPVAAK
jgi:hypothetical protein